MYDPSVTLNNSRVLAVVLLDGATCTAAQVVSDDNKYITSHILIPVMPRVGSTVNQMKPCATAALLSEAYIKPLLRLLQNKFMRHTEPHKTKGN